MTNEQQLVQEAKIIKIIIFEHCQKQNYQETRIVTKKRFIKTVKNR